MSIFHEIRNQPPVVRQVMYWLSVVAVLGIVGFFWMTTAERNLYFALHPKQSDREQFVAQRNASLPDPLATIGKAFSSMTASIGVLLGFDHSKGFDKQDGTDHNQNAVYPLPLSK